MRTSGCGKTKGGGGGRGADDNDGNKAIGGDDSGGGKDSWGVINVGTALPSIEMIRER